ncbi:MAG: YceI family protein [Flavobacteriaceae bacterium]|nr:YceI family protein [Flavobacteriaceae bacterium]
MKTNTSLKIGLVAVIAFASFAFTSIVNKEVKITESTINWKGYKVAGEHSGTINLKEGVLSFEGDKLVGGNIVIDMASIKVTDMEGEYADNLAGHLKADDFFGTKKFPTATLKFTKLSGHGAHYHVTADLTMKGITSPVSFEMKVEANSATAKFKIDRTKYGIKYGSASFFDDLKDKAISDEFDIDVAIKF